MFSFKRIAPLLLAAALVVPGAAGAAPFSPDAEQAARTALRQAQAHGLPEAPLAAAERGGGLEAAVLAYARAQRGGRAPVARFPKDWALRPAPYDPRPELAAALAADRLPAWLASLPPSEPGYQRLLVAYARYQALAKAGGWPTVAAPLKPGDAGPGVLALRARLAVEDADAPRAGDSYDDGLKTAVARAQARYGLEPDGVAGRATLAALNMSAADRVRQIADNLERWRWMPRSRPARRVELNIADATLTLYGAGPEPVSMRVIVGRPADRTPMFQDQIMAVVLNPPWNVPRAIAVKEIWPKIRKDPGYMAREGFVVKPNGDLQQRPGPKCALGAVKFDLANPFGVYLHDTPARSLFAQPNRTLSHGCMRVEQPNLMAKRILDGDPQWMADQIDAALLSGKTVRVPLRSGVAVYVAYFTAFVDGAGTVQFRRDVYGWDKALEDLLAGA